MNSNSLKFELHTLLQSSVISKKGDDNCKEGTAEKLRVGKAMDNVEVDS